MTTPTIPTGDFLLPVCIKDDDDIHDLLSALDLYRVLRKKKRSYPAFDAVLDALDYASNPQDSPCADDSGEVTGFDCEVYDMTSPAAILYPNDPFSSGSYTSIPIAQAKWATIDEVLGLDILPSWAKTLQDMALDRFLGYHPNDLVVWADENESAPIWQVIQELFNGNFEGKFPYPTVTIRVDGAGTISIEFLNLPLGGRAIILNDLEPSVQLIIDIFTDTITGEDDALAKKIKTVELNRDVTSLPIESASTVSHEITFTDEGEHVVRILFSPVLDDSFPFIYPFGGIRGFKICEGLTVKSFETGEEIRPYDLKKGLIMTTKEELCEAVECGFVRIANRIVSAGAVGGQRNIKDGISIGKDGQIIIDKVAGRINFDPPPGAAPEAILYGQAYALASGFKGYVANIMSYYDQYKATKTILEISSELTRRIPFLYTGNDAFFAAIDPNDANSSVAFAAYKYFLETSMANVTPYIDETKIANLAYCEPSSLRKSIQKYTIDYEDGGGTDVDVIAEGFRRLLSLISDEQLEQWYASGAAQPREGYTSTPCYRYESYEIVYKLDDAINLKRIEQLTPEWDGNAVNRLVRVVFSGRFVSSDGNNILTAKHLKTGATIANANWTIAYRRPGGTSSIVPPSNAAFSEAGKYAFEFEHGGTVPFIEMKLNAKPPWLDNTATGEIKLQFIDLGAV